MKTEPPTAATQPPWQWLLDKLDAAKIQSIRFFEECQTEEDLVSAAKILRVLGKRKTKK